MNAFVLANAIVGEAKERRLTDAINHIIEAYYGEFEDAEELDPEFRGSMEAIFDVCFPCGENSDGEDFAAVADRGGES